MSPRKSELAAIEAGEHVAEEDRAKVEQDILPGMGTPKESARRNREYLRSIESNFN